MHLTKLETRTGRVVCLVQKQCWIPNLITFSPAAPHRHALKFCVSIHPDNKLLSRGITKARHAKGIDLSSRSNPRKQGAITGIRRASATYLESNQKSKHASTNRTINQQIKPQIDTIMDCTKLGWNPSAHTDLLGWLLPAHTGLHPTGHQGNRTTTTFKEA